MPATQKKEKKVAAKKEKPSETTAKATRPRRKRPANAKSSQPKEDFKARTDQVGSILHRSLDLVETSIGLGINIISKLGSLTQEQIVERFGRQNTASSQSPSEPQQQYQDEQGVSEEQKAGFCVINRLPLFPGSEVRIPFSINNDSPIAEKKLRLQFEFPLGETFGNPAIFSIKPKNISIAPMDFEKLILTGNVPGEAPAGTYNGWIVVSGDEAFRIPVMLTITERP